MAEDYTWDAAPVTDVTSLRQRVQELESALSEQCVLTAQFIEQRAGLERENAELRADWVDKNDVLTQSAQVMEFAEDFKRRAEAAEAQLNATGFALANSALIQRVRQLERENAALTREVVGLRYYIAQLERNVTAEERAYAAGVASLMVSQAVQP